MHPVQASLSRALTTARDWLIAARGMSVQASEFLNIEGADPGA